MSHPIASFICKQDPGIALHVYNWQKVGIRCGAKKTFVDFMGFDDYLVSAPGTIRLLEECYGRLCAYIVGRSFEIVRRSQGMIVSFDEIRRLLKSPQDCDRHIMRDAEPIRVR